MSWDQDLRQEKNILIKPRETGRMLCHKDGDHILKHLGPTWTVHDSQIILLH